MLEGRILEKSPVDPADLEKMPLISNQGINRESVRSERELSQVSIGWAERMESP
jgi:hypothetical protein